MKDLDAYFSNMAILGAAGKMGRGIAFLALQEAAQALAKTGQTFRLVCFDISYEYLDDLKKYLRAQLVKFAERHMIDLRKWYAQDPQLVDNSEMVAAFVAAALDRVIFTTALQEMKGTRLLFEAVLENVASKVELLRACRPLLDEQALILTNTSSIPIHVLDEKAELQGRITGFHFYNPPPVQRLLELIQPAHVQPWASEVAREVAHRFHKTIVESADVAGFIGNGHFMREILFACQMVEELASSMPRSQALFTIDKVTREFLIRPMGIFQLVDYVGLDVGLHITEVMRTYLGDGQIALPLLSAYFSKGIKGGQNPDGSQRNGLLQYEKGMPTAVYDLETEKYQTCVLDLGPLPSGHIAWKQAQRDPKIAEKLDLYLAALFQSSSSGALLAQKFSLASARIAQNLVTSGVAKSLADVDQVLQLGFYHLYGANEILKGSEHVSIS